MLKQFSYSQALLALAIAFLAFSLFKFTLQIPAIIDAVEKTTQTVDVVSPKIDDIISEVALVRGEVGKVRAVVSQQTPAILSQIQTTLPVVQQVVAESEHYSRQLPALLAQLTIIEQQVEQLQASIPVILERVDAVVKTTENTTSEVALWRPHSTRYLEEIALSREDIPQYLSRVENIIVDAKSVGSEASSGIVSGFFKGVFRLPFEMASGLTNIVDVNSLSAKNLTAQDVVLMQERTVSLLNDTHKSMAIWQNVESGNRGTIHKGKSTTRNKEDCINLTFNNHFGSKKETLKKLMCINDKALWRVI